MISKSLSISDKFASLDALVGVRADFARTLYMLMITHADDHGRLPGDEGTVKRLVIPYSQAKLSQITQALTVLQEAGLIVWYQVDGQQVVEIVKFSDHQYLKGHESRASIYPANNGGGQKCCPKLPKVALTKPNLTEPNLREPNVQEHSSADADYVTFRDAYPAERRVGGEKAKSAFRHARKSVTLDAMLAALEQHKRSDQWHDPKLIPLMTTWLNGERWIQRLPEAAAVLSSVPVIAIGTRPEHRNHAVCGRVCVPEFLHADFVGLRGGPKDIADKELRAWYRWVLQDLGERPIGEPDSVKFWRAEFKTAYAPAVGTHPRTAGNLAAAERWLKKREASA